MNVITLIATDEAHFDEQLINKLFGKLEKRGAVIVNFTWLASGKACDILFEELGPAEAHSIATELVSPALIDIIVQEVDQRAKKLLISDMDSTMIEQECIDEIADSLGIKDHVADITEKAMNGELEFNQALEERVALLKGISASELETIYRDKITFMPGAKTLVQTMKKQEAATILVSGGFTFFAEKVAKDLGFDKFVANELVIKNGTLTGTVKHPIIGSETKLDILKKHVEDTEIDLSETLAIGDGSNDLPMLMHSGLGIAYRAKDHVKAQANAALNYVDLHGALYAQGIKQEMFEREDG